VSVHGRPTTRVTAVFVGAQIKDGFVDIDRGVLNSIKDLKGELSGRKGIQIVEDKTEARLVLEVLSRGATSSAGGGAMGMPIGASTFVIPFGTIGLATILRVGTYEKAIVFQNCQTWRHCAKLVAEDVQTWIAANGLALEQSATVH
jgi:hypothetical protein